MIKREIADVLMDNGDVLMNKYGEIATESSDMEFEMKPESFVHMCEEAKLVNEEITKETIRGIIEDTLAFSRPP
jgi:hypothetical protein